MTTRDLVESLRQQGVVLIPDGDRLRIDAPTGVLTQPLRQKLTQHKAEILEHLHEEHNAIAALSLDELAQAGLVIRVHSTVLENEVLFVSDNVPDEAIHPQGLPIYRAHELEKLAILRPAPRDLRRIHEVKEVFKGTIAAVEDWVDVEG